MPYRNIENRTNSIFSEDPTTPDYYLKYINPETRDLYSEIERLKSQINGTNVEDLPLSERFNNLMSQFRESSRAKIGDNAASSLFGEDNTSQEETESRGGLGERLTSFFGEQGEGITDNAINAGRSVLQTATTVNNSDAGTALQGISTGIQGAKLGVSVGGPIGGVIGGLGGLAYGLIDGKNDKEKIKQEKIRRYKDMLSETKDYRRRNYLAQEGRY